jgi:hypothetical protein
VSNPALEGTVQCVGKITDGGAGLILNASRRMSSQVDISQVSMLKFLFFFQIVFEITKQVKNQMNNQHKRKLSYLSRHFSIENGRRLFCGKEVCYECEINMLHNINGGYPMWQV